MQSGSIELCGIHSTKVLNLGPNIYQKSSSQRDSFYDEEEEKFSIRVVKLREGAWYGDFQILTNTRSNWEIRALKGGRDGAGDKTNKVQVFELDA